jgi:PAS domain S-box-containing protein
MTGSVQSKAANSIFANGGEMGELMRSLDWSQTPIGSVESWSQSLKSLVKTLLTSRYPMVLTWGAEFTQFYNDAYSQLIGDKHPTALGTDIRETLAEAWDTLGPMIQRVMATGVANWTPALPLVLERAGYREESYFSVSHAPAEDDAGQIVGMLAVCSEVTQQVLGERRLRLLRDLAAQTGETRSVQDTCQDLMSAIAAHPLDVPFALLYLRESDGRTFTLQGAVGLTVDDQLCPRSVDLATNHPLWSFALAAAGETVPVEALDHQMTVLGGPWNEPVQTALMMPIASGQTTPLGVLVAGVNPNRALDEGYRSFYELLVGQVSVSIRNAQAYEEERRRAETLAELDRAKTAFFSNVSHEFRTPLTLMLNPLEEVLQSDKLPPTEREQITIAQRNAQRLLKLVNTLLDFSRIEAGRAQAHFEPTDLATYTVELTSLFQSAIEQAGLRLIVDCPSLPQSVSVDRDMWEKIVLNLLSNAFKFTLEGEITVSLHSVGNQVELIVRDTGTGIPEADLPRLFERFHRVEGAQGRTFEGTGIGLSLVQELVHLHNGTIAVESSLGQGSTFRVQLPLNPTPAVSLQSVGADSALETRYPDNRAQPTDSATPYVQEASSWLRENDSVDAPSSPLSPSSSASSPARIFLVDDNADMRTYLHRILSEFYQVEVFTEGSAALHAARASTPDLVLSDVMMPGMDGFELLKQLRRDPQTREIPILLLSARAGEEAAVEGLSAGADDYLVKPFSVRELLARVAVNVELGRSRQAAAHRRLDRVLSSVSDLIYTFDFAGRFTYANQPLLDLWQKPLADIIGRNFFDLDYPPELADRLQQQIQHVITTCQPLKAETSYTSASGTRVYEYIFVPLFDADGAVEAVAGTGRDISDRKQAEIALRESEQRFRTLTATIPQLIWTATPDGSVDYLSQQWADYIGLPLEQLHDWHWQDVVHLEDLPNTLRDWNHSLEVGEPIDIKHRFRFRTGEWRWQLVRGTPIKDEAGQITKWVGTCTDIQSEIDAQAALRQREQRLTLATAAAQLGVFEWLVPEDVALWENDRVYEIFGHARADGTVSRQNFFEDYLHPDDAAAFDAKLAEGMETGKLHQAICRIRRKDGEMRWIEFNGQFEFATDGSPLRLVGVIADITDRKLAEQAAAADLTDMQRLHDLSTRLSFESDIQVLYDEILAAAIAIMQADAGSIQLLHTQTNELTFLATQGLELTLIDYFQSVSASSNTSCGITLANGVRTFVDFDIPGVPDPDGSFKQHLDVGLRSAQSTPLITRSGRAIGMLSTHWRDRHRSSERELRFLDLLTRQAADLMERRQTEAALRDSEELKQRILESSKDCIKLLTLNNEIAYINTGGLQLLEIDNPTLVLNTCWLDFWQGEDYENARKAIAAAKAGNTGQFQGYVATYRGTPKWWDCIITPVRNSAGQITQLVVVSRDITRKKQAEAERERLLAQEQAAREAAETANRSKDEFLAVLSHELRSPLNPILGWTRLLQNGKLDAARQREALNTIERNAKLQTQLIEDLLDISRIMQGKLSLTVAPVSLTFVISAALDTVRLAAEAKNIRIILNLAPEVAPVSGDAARLQQVVWNLLSNAVKFTPNGGQVTIELQQLAQLAQIRVIDTGKGINPQFLPYIFEYFRQEDGSTTRQFGGLGLGLAIARQIVEMHGGTVWAESKGEDQGATFILQLPTTPQAASITPELPRTQAEAGLPLEGVQVLLVDDEPDTREFQAFVLEQGGANVTAVASGFEALQTLDQFTPDVLVSDIGMAEMDGYMLMQQIRSRSPEQGKTAPKRDSLLPKAIALTAYAAEIDQQRALQAGFHAHLTKPVEPEVLVQTIARLCGRNT